MRPTVTAAMTTVTGCAHGRAALGRLVAGVAALPLVVACAISPEERAATERAWAQRDAERAAECAQRGGRYISSSCLQGGSP